MAMEIFTWCPKVLPTGQIKFRTLVAQFGDGYAQRAGDGINTRTETWPLEFVGREDEVTPIAAFLDRMLGYRTFKWTPPLGVEGTYVAPEGYTLTSHGADAYTLNVTFEETFRLVP